jgi:small-conductance mechanosensitive channel
MKALGRTLLSALLLASIASSAGAQFFDLPWPATEADERSEAPRPEPDRGHVPDRDPQPEPEPEPERAVAVTGEAPPAIARPRPGQPTELPERPDAPHERRPLLILFLSLLGVGFALFLIERARSWITANIALSRVFGGLVLILRLVGVGLLLGIVLELIPEGQDWILWALVVLAVVVGWSVRDLFADLVAGAVLAAERRVKKGVWVSGNGFQGTVEGRSLRATWLRDGQGHRLTVPNRAMVGAPMVYDAGSDAEHEVVVRLEGYKDAGKVRMALTDAILSSPWVLAGANPVVLRDPADPVVWRVRTKLLEPRFSVHFEGELLERVEDLLRYEPPAEERETVPTDVPPGS